MNDFYASLSLNVIPRSPGSLPWGLRKKRGLVLFLIRCITHNGIAIRLTTDFSTAMREARGSGMSSRRQDKAIDNQL